MWDIARPQGLLRKLVAESPALRRIFDASNRSTVHSPWGLVHYHDEIVPGNFTAPIVNRRFVTFRFSFKEFGRSGLVDNRLWFEYAHLRSKIIDTVKGGLSRVFKEFMRCFFQVNEQIHEVGVQITIDSGAVLVFAVNRNIVADEKALKMTFDFKGADGIKPCAACANVTKKGVIKKHLKKKGEQMAVEITCPDNNQMVANTDASIWRYHDLLHDYKDKVSRGNFDKMEKAFGIRYNPDGLLADHSLRVICPPLTLLTYDWVHNYLCGIGPIELWFRIRAIKTCGFQIVALRDDVRTWSFPQHLKKGCQVPP